MGYAWGATWALWLGILTSISPCPLATNIAAVSFIGKHLGSGGAGGVLAAGILYTFGRSAVYVALGVGIVAGALSIPGLSFFLQNNINPVLGPLLILVGMVLVDLIHFNLGSGQLISRIQDKINPAGRLAPLALGILFALAFCPVSAALFFGSLLPLAIQHDSPVVLPLLYGAGTALPVLGFAGVLAFSAQSIAAAYSRLTAMEVWARRITGVVFIVAGIYLSLKYVFFVVA
jgi:cytochrome c-type biogenesis protein